MPGQSLAELLGVVDPTGKPLGGLEYRQDAAPAEELTIHDFCKKVLQSKEYRASLYMRIVLNDLPPAIEQLLYYYAEGKPVERVAHLTPPGAIGQIHEIRVRLVQPTKQYDRPALPEADVIDGNVIPQVNGHTH